MTNFIGLKKASQRVLFILMTTGVTPIKAVVHEVPASSQMNVSVTLYPEDKTLIKETRESLVTVGSNKLLIKGVPRSILMDSFIFQSLSPSLSLDVLEYTFEASHITREALLNHSLGKQVKIFSPQNKSTPMDAKLIALDGDEAIVDSFGLIFPIKKTRVAFSRLPYALTPEPLIVLKTSSQAEGKAKFEIGYLANGFSWDAGYTIVVNLDGLHLDLNNWLNIRNQSGMDIHKGHFRVAYKAQEGEKFYDIERPISLSDGSVKNVSWFSAQNLTPVTSFRIFPENNIVVNEEGVVMKPTVETWLSVRNEPSQGLGLPFPEGVMRVFRRNVDGSLFYIGENKTPRILLGKPLSLRVGSTKDITAEMRQTDYRKLGTKVVESGYRLDLKNISKVEKEVTVFQAVPGEWVVLRETHPHGEEDHRLKWVLRLAPQEDISLRYRIRMNVD